MSGKKNLKDYFLQIVRLEENASAGATAAGAIAFSTAVGHSGHSPKRSKKRSSPARKVKPSKGFDLAVKRSRT